MSWPPPPVPATTADAVPADAVLLDVREDDEWAAGHAPSAVHVPLGDLPERLGDLPDADVLVVVCRSGGRSSRAVQWLAAQGYDAVNLDGGMQAWESAGRPMVSEDGGPARVV